MNADFAALFQEKKYRELLAMAMQSQDELVKAIKRQTDGLNTVIQNVRNLSANRMNHLKVENKQVEFINQLMNSTQIKDETLREVRLLETLFNCESQEIMQLIAAEEAKLKEKADAAKAAEEAQAKEAEANAEEGK